MIFTRSFMTAVAERALKSFAGALLAFLPAGVTDALPTLNWGDMLTFAGYAALASVLFSIASTGVGGTGPSLANEVISPPAVDPEAGHSTVEVVLISALVAVVVVVAYVLIR